MDSSIFITILLGVVLSVTGCANVKFYSDEDLKKETGLKYFETKPYVLVARKSKDAVDISIVHLPDKTKPQYAVFSPGLGSHQFSVSLSNGILTSYGQTADSKIPELINSVAGLLKEGVATATSAGVFSQQGATNYASLADELDNVGKTLLKAIQENQMTDAQKSLDKVTKIKQEIVTIASELRVPVPKIAELLPKLKSSRDDLNLLIQKVSTEKYGKPSAVDYYNAALTAAINRIDAVIGLMVSDPAPIVVFELYEILQDDVGKPSLRKVP
ncbi:MAG: hypothetical protein HRU77_09785 [Gammaproteobacteria bacterium]|nr:MAG: hypothetical protein HRU77_09785 [Gammaproteobacteria bacterium]